jgi:hypothetical protein
MRKNMGTTDRLLRTLVVAPLAVVGAFLVGPGSILGFVLFAVAAIMLGTAAVGSCPIFTVLGIRSCPARSAKAT